MAIIGIFQACVYYLCLTSPRLIQHFLDVPDNKFMVNFYFLKKFGIC